MWSRSVSAVPWSSGSPQARQIGPGLLMLAIGSGSYPLPPPRRLPAVVAGQLGHRLAAGQDPCVLRDRLLQERLLGDPDFDVPGVPAVVTNHGSDQVEVVQVAVEPAPVQDRVGVHLEALRV